jgi:aryl-alcohol dehydrogenase-like predicted oxidoreductase
VIEAGAGVQLRTKHLTPERLRATVREAMSMRAQAEAAGKRLRAAGGGARFADAAEELARAARVRGRLSRRLGRWTIASSDTPGLRVSALTLGTMTFGGRGHWTRVGATEVDTATRQVDMCLDAGVNLIDTADVYSDGLSEEVVGKTLKGRRDRVLIATKARFAMGDGPNDAGLSRHHLIRACEASLRRLGTDYIDLFQVHEWDGHTPLEETLSALDHLGNSGKVRYIGCSNYAAWHIMKALGISERKNLQRFISQQIYYSLQARDAEYELVPVALDQGVGILVWSPLAGGLLSGKYRRGQDMPEGSRHLTDWNEPPVTTRTSSTTSSTCWWRSPRRVACRRRRSRSRGRSAGPASRPWSSGRAPRSSSPTTSAPPTSRSRTTSARGSTRSARRG